MSAPTENHYKIRLAASGVKTLAEKRKNSVVFEVTPELNEQRTVQYDFLDPVHAPGQIAVYKRTMSRRFQLTSIKLASRTPEEASTNLAYLWTLRGWTMPYFGKPKPKDTKGVRTGRAANEIGGGRKDSEYIKQIITGLTRGANQEYLGAPPQSLELTAYSKQGKSLGHLYRVPVVIESLGILYPSDVDYIPTDEADPTPMPTVMTIDIALIETQSPKALSNFSLSDYRLGNLQKTNG